MNINQLQRKKSSGYRDYGSEGDIPPQSFQTHRDNDADLQYSRRVSCLDDDAMRRLFDLQQQMMTAYIKSWSSVMDCWLAVRTEKAFTGTNQETK